MISIITVNWNSYDFLQLLIESIDRFTHVPWSLIVIDNSSKQEIVFPHPHIHVYPQEGNIGHGAGLNKGVELALDFKHPYLMFVDVDCHFLCHDWHESFVKIMQEGYSVIGGRGVPEKPIRPACMWLSREVAGKYDYRDTPGYKGHRITPKGFDVAIQAYHKMRADNVAIKLIESCPNRYGTLNGEEWEIDGKSLLYHHWHGTHLMERGVDFPDDDLFYDKDLLFSKIPWRIP